MTAARITFGTTPDQFAGPYGAAPQGPPICQGQDSNLTPRSYAIHSPHILATNRGVHLNRTGYPAGDALVGFAVGTTYPAN